MKDCTQKGSKKRPQNRSSEISASNKYIGIRSDLILHLLYFFYRRPNAGVMKRNDPPLQNDPWVTSLRRGMTRVIILCRKNDPMG